MHETNTEIKSDLTSINGLADQYHHLRAGRFGTIQLKNIHLFILDLFFQQTIFL